MSFLRNLYKNFSPDRQVKGDPFNAEDFYSPVLEDFDTEDGFVVYTGKIGETNTRSSGGKEYECLQNSAPGSQTPYHGNCQESGSSAAGKKVHNNTTFLTVSDIPLQLSKPLEMMYTIEDTAKRLERPSLNMNQFFYDFHLERTIVKSHEVCDSK